MARFFREEDIEEFRECFYLFCKKSYITSESELSLVMRSLGMSPTKEDLSFYFESKKKRLSFADFLDVMHLHKEKLPDDIVKAFNFIDTDNRGFVKAHHLRSILTNWGEKLNRKEVDQMFREHQIAPSGNVRYEQFAKMMCDQLNNSHKI